jgi:hypothetical protein
MPISRVWRDDVSAESLMNALRPNKRKKRKQRMEKR